jgi:hypothetical protein
MTDEEAEGPVWTDVDGQQYPDLLEALRRSLAPLLEES